MAAEHSFDPALIQGLEALVDTTFPKSCKRCGRHFVDAADYARQTAALSAGATDTDQAGDEGDTAMVETCRNCPCGSPLADSFSDRRNQSTHGQARRQRFGELLAYLLDRGLNEVIARQELLTVLQGGRSELLEHLARSPHP